MNLSLLKKPSSARTHSYASRFDILKRQSRVGVLGDDAVCLCGPHEGLGMCVSVIDPIDDGGLELRHAVEGVAADALAGDFGK
jgi:hypothetical protein